MKHGKPPPSRVPQRRHVVKDAKAEFLAALAADVRRQWLRAWRELRQALHRRDLGLPMQTVIPAFLRFMAARDTRRLYRVDLRPLEEQIPAEEWSEVWRGVKAVHTFLREATSRS